MNLSPTCSIVVPVHCEAEGIRHTIRKTAAIMHDTGVAFEIVLIDDGSTDSSWEALIQAQKEFPFVRALKLTRRFGKEAAMHAGLSAARGQAVVVMDADLQHPPQLIPEMLRLWQEARFDVIEGVKQQAEQGDRRGFFRQLFFKLNIALTKVDLCEASDFKLLDRRVVDAYLALPERNLFFRGMVAWSGYRTATLPFTPQERQYGQTQWSFRALARLALTSITSFSSAPLHLITIIGLVFIGLAFLFGLQTLYNKLSGHAVDGFTTVIMLLLITGSAIMLALGVIGEYLARIYDEVKRRPLYFVQETLPASVASATRENCQEKSGTEVPLFDLEK